MFLHMSVILYTRGWQADTPPGTATAADGTHPIGMHSCYHPQTKLREGNVFTGVCDSVHGHPPPRTATAAGGAHPTGMHSCQI